MRIFKVFLIVFKLLINRRPQIWCLNVFGKELNNVSCMHSNQFIRIILSIYPSIYPTIYPPIYPSIYFSFCPSISFQLSFYLVPMMYLADFITRNGILLLQATQKHKLDTFFLHTHTLFNFHAQYTDFLHTKHFFHSLCCTAAAQPQFFFC